MEGSNGSQDTPGLPRVGRGIISMPVDKEFHRCESLPLTSVRKDFFYDVLVPVKVTESSRSGGSANERGDAISVEGVFCS